MPKEKKIVVIGVGNILMGDDGLGIYAIERLRQENLPPRVEVIDGGTVGIDLIYLLEEAEYALIIDCLDCGETPGMMFRIPWGEISDSNREEQIISLHDVNLWSVLSLAEKLNRLPQVVIFEPCSFKSVMRYSSKSPEAEITASCNPALSSICLDCFDKYAKSPLSSLIP